MILEHFGQTNEGDWLTPSSNRNGTYEIGPKQALKEGTRKLHEEGAQMPMVPIPATRPLSRPAP